MKHPFSIFLDPDVNPGGGSSTTATEVASGSTDATTSTQADVKAEPQGLDASKIIAEVLGKKKEEPSPSGEEKEESPGLQKTPTKEEGEKEESPETTDETKQEEVVDETKPVPYDRFKEVNEQKQTFETQVKELQPLAEAQRSIMTFCQENNISSDDFVKGMELLKMVNTDPVEARKMLEPIWNQLSGLTGDALPQDLKQAVDDGAITEAYAKEIAKHRGMTAHSQARGQLTGQRAEQQKQQQFVSTVQSAVKTWSDGKVVTDPDFKAKAGPNAPDGKYDFFGDRFYKLMINTPPKNVADAVKLAEQAYGDISKTFSSFGRRQGPTKSVSSTKSSTSSVNDKTPFSKDGQVPKSLIENVLAKYKS